MWLRIGFLFLAAKNTAPLTLSRFFTKRHKLINHNFLFLPKYKNPQNRLKSFFLYFQTIVSNVQSNIYLLTEVGCRETVSSSIVIIGYLRRCCILTNQKYNDFDLGITISNFGEKLLSSSHTDQ